MFKTIFALVLLCSTTQAVPFTEWRDKGGELCDSYRDAGKFACSWNAWDIVCLGRVSGYGIVC